MFFYIFYVQYSNYIIILLFEIKFLINIWHPVHFAYFFIVLCFTCGITVVGYDLFFNDRILFNRPYFVPHLFFNEHNMKRIFTKNLEKGCESWYAMFRWNPPITNEGHQLTFVCVCKKKTSKMVKIEFWNMYLQSFLLGKEDVTVVL